MTGYRIISPDGNVYCYGHWTVKSARGQVWLSMTAAMMWMVTHPETADCTIEPVACTPVDYDEVEDPCPPTERNT